MLAWQCHCQIRRGESRGRGTSGSRCARHRRVRASPGVSPQQHKSTVAAAPEPTGGTLEERAARFAQVGVRPSQAAFRRALFLAHRGRCAISGCDVETALDAAHLHGRDWRRGHNPAQDGLLLRKDLRALYDRRLLTIAESGVVELSPSLTKHYRDYSGCASKRPPCGPDSALVRSDAHHDCLESAVRLSRLQSPFCTDTDRQKHWG